MGCAGRIANGVNVVYCSYATPDGHALVGARIYVPADQLADQARRAACGIGAEVTFRTKPQLALDICRDMITDATMPPGLRGTRYMAVRVSCGSSCKTTELAT